MKMTAINNNIKQEMLRRFCETTTFDGVSEIYESRDKKNHFVFWTVVVSTMCFASLWFTYRTIKGYIETPTVTNVATVRSNTLDLPEILVCYNGGLNASAMKESLSDNLIVALTTNFLNRDDQISNKILAIEELEKFTKLNNMEIKDLVRKFSFACEDIVAGVKQPSDMLLQPDGCQFIVPSLFSGGTGMCFILKNISQQTYPGLEDGVLIKLKAPSNSFVRLFPNESRMFEIEDNFRLTLEKTIGLAQSERWVTISPGMRTEITLWTKLYKRDPAITDCEIGGCYDNSNTCFYSCYIKATINTCNCTPIDHWSWDSMFQNIPSCNPLTFDQCPSPLEETYSCQQNCKPMCREWIFEASYTYSFITSKTDAVIVVAYNTLQYTQIEELQSFTLDMAVANVGGQSGLWLGCSIITIIHAVYYLVLACTRCIKRRQQEVKVAPVTKNSGL